MRHKHELWPPCFDQKATVLLFLSLTTSQGAERTKTLDDNHVVVWVQ